MKKRKLFYVLHACMSALMAAPFVPAISSCNNTSPINPESQSIFDSIKPTCYDIQCQNDKETFVEIEMVCQRNILKTGHIIKMSCLKQTSKNDLIFLDTKNNETLVFENTDTLGKRLHHNIPLKINTEKIAAFTGTYDTFEFSVNYTEYESEGKAARKVGEESVRYRFNFWHKRYKLPSLQLPSSGFKATVKWNDELLVQKAIENSGGCLHTDKPIYINETAYIGFLSSSISTDYIDIKSADGEQTLRFRPLWQDGSTTATYKLEGLSSDVILEQLIYGNKPTSNTITFVFPEDITIFYSYYTREATGTGWYGSQEHLFSRTIKQGTTYVVSIE